MTLKWTAQGSTAAVNLFGPLTFGRPVDQLQKSISTLLQSGFREIRLNLRSVPYADASGLGCIVACRRQAETAGAELTVDGLNARMKALFRLTGLSGLSDRPERRKKAAAREERRHARAAGPRALLLRLARSVA